MLWICPKLEDARYEGDAELKGFNINNLPASLKIGLPPAMTANDTDWLWDGDESHISKHPPWWAKIPVCERWRPGAKASEIFYSRTPEQCKYNARQLVSFCRMGDAEDLEVHAEPCAEAPQ